MPRLSLQVVLPPLLALLCACGGGPGEPSGPGTPDSTKDVAAPGAPTPQTGAAGAGYAVRPSLDAGRVAGRVLFQGTPPAAAPIAVNKDVSVCGKDRHVAEDLLVGAGGGLQNAVVSLEGIAAGKPFPPDLKPTLDQRGCWFYPHVQVVPAGATIEILNNDGILHNIHTYPGVNPPVNMAQPKFRKVLTTSFARPDVVKVACDVHGWMTAWIVVAGHPYHAVTGADGAFSLDGVPPGAYTLRAWHESLGTREQPVTVGPGAVVEASLAFGG